TNLGVKLGGSAPATEPASWGDVLVAFDKETAKKGGLLFVDEMQDFARLPDRGQKMARGLRAALQMARHVTPVFAGSVQHLLAPVFATSASAFFKSIRLQHHLEPFPKDAFAAWASRIFRGRKRQLEEGALSRLYELTAGVTEDIVATCAEIWMQEAAGRAGAPADVEAGWRNVVANAAQYFLPRISALSGTQARLLRHVARNPRAQPFSEETLAAIKSDSGPTHRALRKLIELELLREEQRDGRRRVWVHDARLEFYLRA